MNNHCLPVVFYYLLGDYMKKINILKKNEDYNRIIQHLKPYKYKDYIIYLEKTKENCYHFGFSVGKKVGNAVTRNKIKRQLKNILDKKDYKKGFNCIIIVKKSILAKSFSERELNLWNALEKLNIIKENTHEEKNN